MSLSLIERIKETAWESKSQSEIMAYKALVDVAKKLPRATVIAKELMLNELLKAARDHIDGPISLHYLNGKGATFKLTDVNVRHILTGIPPGYPVDLSLNDYSEEKQRKEWLDAFAAVRNDRSLRIDYSGRMNWAHANNTIANFAVNYEGTIAWQAPNPVVQNGPVFPMWLGKIRISDRFDLDPHWDWSPANMRGRSQIGERRTRIGFILDLGTDFDITGPDVLGVQLMFERRLMVKQLSLQEYVDLTLKAAAAP